MTTLDVAFLAVSISQPVLVMDGALEAWTVLPTVPDPSLELSYT